MAPEVKPAKNSKLPKLPENYFEPAGKGGWPPISTWINGLVFLCHGIFPFLLLNGLFKACRFLIK
jgi:hypothetical protein